MDKKLTVIKKFHDDLVALGERLRRLQSSDSETLRQGAALLRRVSFALDLCDDLAPFELLEMDEIIALRGQLEDWVLHCGQAFNDQPSIHKGEC